MSKDFWHDSGASLQMKKEEKGKTKMGNAYGEIRVEKDKDTTKIEVARKSEYHEPTFFQNRETLEHGHHYEKTTSFGTFTTDSHQKDSSAVRYETSVQTPDKKVFQHLKGLKDKIDNDTLEEMLPENAMIQKRLYAALKQTKQPKEEEIREKLRRISKLEEGSMETLESGEEEEEGEEIIDVTE